MTLAEKMHEAIQHYEKSERIMDAVAELFNNAMGEGAIPLKLAKGGGPAPLHFKVAIMKKYLKAHEVMAKELK